MEKTWKPELRKHIGLKVRELRKKRSMSQDFLARLLGVSQGWLSSVEKGEGSLTAEQLLEIFKIFNEVPQTFDLAKREPEAEFQRALAQQGAGHLFQDPRVLPSDLNQDTETTIREVLLDGRNPRQITAIAPVLARNYDKVDLKRLWARFVDYHLQNRLGWTLESVAEAIGKLVPRLTSNDARPLRRAETALRNFLDIRQPENFELLGQANASNEVQKSDWEWNEISSHLDVLGEKTQSWKSIHNHWISADPTSRRWGVVSSLKTQDFYDALKAGLNLQEIRESNDTV
jgi:transcriptional regulator with XRE-family HTH domain